jgi:hypothetical protein
MSAQSDQRGVIVLTVTDHLVRRRRAKAILTCRWTAKRQKMRWKTKQLASFGGKKDANERRGGLSDARRKKPQQLIMRSVFHSPS